MEMLTGPLSAPKACVQGGNGKEGMGRGRGRERRIGKDPLLGYVQAVYTGCVRKPSMRDVPSHCSLSDVTC